MVQEYMTQGFCKDICGISKIQHINNHSMSSFAQQLYS